MTTEAVQLEHNSESLQYIAQKYDNVPATDNNSSSYATTKDEALNLAEEEKLSGRKGEIIIEPPIDIQFSLKETDVQCVNIVSEKLKDEGHLTGNNNNIEARSETDDTAHILMEEVTSDMDVLALDKASIIVESASQKTLQQKDEAVSEEKENESHDTTDVKKVEGVNENKHAKIEAETGIPYVESTGDSDDMPIAECLQHLQETTQKGPDPAEAKPVDENSEGPFKVDPKDAEKEKHDGIDEDMRMEVETGKFNEEGIQVTNNISAKEPAENENTQEAPEIAQPLEVATRGELESANDGPEDDKLSIPFNVNTEEPDEQNTKRTNEDNLEKREAESGICREESTNCMESISVAEPSEELNREETLATTTNEDPEPPEDGQDHSKFESPLESISREPEEELERENEVAETSQEQNTHCISPKEPAEKENTQEAPEIAQPLDVATRGELESADDGPEDDMLNLPFNVNTKEPEEENTERANEDRHRKIEVESGTYSEERTHSMESISVAEPSGEENREESLETTTNKGPELPEDGQDCGKFESPLESISTEPDAELQRENEEPSQEQYTRRLEIINEKILQPANDEPDSGKPEYDLEETSKELGEGMLGIANEDAKIEVETSSHERDIHFAPVAKPSEQENLEDPPETTEAARNNKQESGEVESPLGAVSDGPEPDNLHKVNEENNAEIVAHDIDNQSVAQPSEKENKHETFEITTEEAPESAGGEKDVLNLEGPIGAVAKKPDAENFERINEDEHVEMEAETRSFNDERANDTRTTPAREYQDKLITQEPLEVAATENVKLAEDETGGKLENPLNALPEEPELTVPFSKLSDSSLEADSLTAKHEIEATCHEELVISVEKSAPEDEKRYEAIEKVESEPQPDYQNGNAISQDMQSEVKEIEDSGSKVISSDSLPDIHNETSQKVDNIDGEASHPLNEEKTDESITINGGDNFGKSKAGKLENSSDSVTNELNLEELAPEIVCGEDKTSEVANTNDGEVVTPPSNNMQETCVEVPEQQIRTVSENVSTEITSTLKDEEKEEDNRTSLPEEELGDDPQKKVEETAAISEEDKHIEQVTQMNIETMGDTLYSNGVSFNDNMQEAVTTIAQEQTGRTIESDGRDEAICSNEHIKEQDKDASLQKDNPEDEPRKKQEDTHEAIKEVKNTEPVSQMCIETMGDNFSADDASLDKNMHEASDVVAEEQMYTKTEDGSIEIMPISTNENRREQDIDKSQPKEELKDEPRKKEEITHEEISGMVKPDGGKGDGNCEADLNENLDDCPNSHVLDEETTEAEAGQTNAEGPDSTNEDQIHPATYTKDDREVDVSEELKSENFKTVPGSQVEDKCDETGAFNVTEVDNSKYNNNPNAVILGAADLNEDKTTNINDEANQNTDEGDSYGSPTEVEPRLSGEADDHEEASKTESRQISQPEGNLRGDICAENANAKEFERINQSEDNDHIQEGEAKVTHNLIRNDNIGEVILEIGVHNNGPETEEVKIKHTLEKGFGTDSDTQVLVSEVAKDVLAEKHDNTLEITNIESIKEVVVQETENKDINEETKSAVIDKAINIGEDEESLSTGVETAAASTSRSYLEENVEENVNELESDDKLEKNYLFDIRDENLPMQEEAVHNTQETTLSAVSADSAEVINESQVEGCESATNNTNLGSIGYNGEPESENATTEVADIDPNKGRYDDNTKNRMTEGKFSDTEVIQKNLPPLAEIRSAQTQFSEDTCQTMKADACEYQVSDEKIECKKNYNTTSQDMESEVEELEDNGSKAISDDNLPDILSETSQEENIDEKAADSSNEEKTNESITIYDHDNLDKSKDGELENSSGSVTKEPDLEELTGAVVYREEKISEEANTNDGEVVTSGTPFQEKEGSELYITRDFDSEEKVERLEQKSNNKEDNPNKEEIIDACLGVSDKGSNEPRKAEIRCLSVQGIEEEEEASRNNEQDKDAELVEQMDRVTMSETLYAASPGNNIQETYKKDPEQQIHNMSVDGSTEVYAILKDEKEEDEDIQTSLPKEELQDDPQKQAEETTAIAEEDTYLEQVAQMNIAPMGDRLYDNGVSFEKNMQEGITTIVQEQTGRTVESDSKDDAISSNEHIREQDIETSLQKDNLDDEAPEKEEENHEAIKKVKNTEPVLQMCIETMGDNISTSDASIDKNMQEASDVVTEEQICTIKEGESIEVMPIPTNENKSKQVIDKRPQEELKDEPQKKEEINLEEQASVVVAEELFHGVPEDDSIEVREISNNENKEEQSIYASSQKEEQEDGPQEKKEEINDIDETFSLKHGKDPESVSQVNMETTDATSYANNASFDKNIQEAPLVVEKEQIPNMPEDDSIEIKEISKTENKEEQYICTSPQKVELEDEPQEKKVVINANDEESVYAEAVPEMNIERTDYIKHANNASSGKSIATVVFAEGVLSMPEDNNKDVEKISKNLHIEENDIHSSLPIENLEFEPQAKEDKINVPEKEVGLEHAEDVIYQMDMGTDAILYANIASSDNNMQKPSILAVEEQIHDVPDDGGVEEKAIPETDNKEEQDIHTSLPKEEPEQEPKDKEEEETYGTCEEVKNVVRASQVDINTTSETLNVNDASFEKNMQDIFVIYPEEQIHGMPEDDNVEASEFPENKNEEEQNIQASLQEADAAPQEKQNEIEIEQKSNDISNLTMISENESFKEKELTENSSEKGKLENQDIESFNLVLDDLEKVDTTEDIHEIETKNAVKDIEENVCKEQNMILVDPMLESAPDNQNSKPSCTTKGASSEEEILKSTCLIKGVTKVDADNEGCHCVTEVYVTHEKPEQSDINITQNGETAERSELLSTNTSFVSKEIGGETKNVEKDIVHKENASEITSAKIQDYETETQTSNKPAVDTLISHQIKEFNHPSPKHSITVTYPSEDLAPSLTTAPQSEETYEDAGEKFSRISDYWPRQDTNEASNVNAMGMKHSKETRGVVEGLADAEKPLCISSGSASTSERDVKGEEVVALPTDSGLYDIFKATEKLKEVPYLVPTEEADEKTSSVNEIRDDEESLHEPSAGQEPEVDQPEQTKKEKEMSDKAFYDNVEFSDLQNEEKKHMALGDLPISQFLMKHVLQEQDDTKGARDDEYIDVVNEQNEEGNENDDNAAKTRDITLPVSTVQPVKETSTAQSKVDSEKLENSASVEEEEGCDVNANSEIPPAKDGKTLQSSPDYSPSGEVVAASEKNEINTPAPKVLTDSPSKESMELASTEPSILGSKVDTEECRNPDIVQGEQDNASVSEENLTEKVNNKDDESMDNSADNSYFRKAAEEDNLQKGGEQSTEHQLEIQTLEDFCAESERQFTMDDHKLKAVTEIESEVTQFETGEEKQNSEKQVQVPNRDTNEELKPSELHESQQSNVAIESDIHNLQIAQKLPEGNDSAVSLDKKHIAEPTKEEEDECPPKQSALNATTALEAKDADLEPLEKSDQTNESSEPSPFNYNKLKEAMEIEPAIKDSQSDKETREVTDRNKVKILKDDLTEKLQPSKLQKFEQSNLVVEPANQQLKTAEKVSDEEHKVKTTHLKEDEDITDGESDEKEEEGTQKAEESSHDTTVTVETRDVELKPQKKSHGILSGVGSKVKKSIAKVKKAIKGKSPHSKVPSAK